MTHTISIDNGNSTTTAQNAIDTLGFEIIHNVMDAEICQMIEGEAETEADFINEYLKHAEIVIG